MKEKELREVAKCAICGKGIGHTSLPFFYRVRIERYRLNAGALQRQTGLEMMVGPLAGVMGPNEDMAEKVSSKEVTVCVACSVRQTMVAALAMED